MQRRCMSSISFAAAVIALLAACNQAPKPPAAPATPAAPAAPAPAAASTPVALTYQCHSEQKSRDIFIRLDPTEGFLWSVSFGPSAATFEKAEVTVSFGKDGIATWSTKLPNGSETNSFNKNTGEWDWNESSTDGSFNDTATYHCTPV